MNAALERFVLRRPIVAIAAFLHLAGVLGTRPLVPLYATELGIGPSEIGVLVALFAVLPLFLSLGAGRWLDVYGSRPMLLSGTLLAGLGLMLPDLLAGRAGLYASQVVTGSASTLFVLAAQRSIGSQSSDAMSRERNVAVFSLGVALASLAGPVPAGFIAERFSFETAFLLLGGVTLLSLPVCSALAKDRPAPAETGGTRPAGNPLHVLGYNPYMGRAFLISALILMAKDMYIAFFPLYAASAGLSAGAIGLIIGLHNGGGVVMRLALLPLVKAFGKNRVVLSSILLGGMLFLVLPVVEGVVLLTLASLGIGMALGLGQPLSISTTIALSPSDKLGHVLGVRLGFNRLTQAVAPLGFSAALLMTGIAGIFVLVGAVLCLGATRLGIPDEQSS
ncbi:MFS transporter [Jannaschia seohaensis]|uniref:Predicted arabinose efflux permease, MFS family n=1 Tax=Jannaschia seohaensis TaxID=475081 RepID=A0A2Y9AQS0_9RHOB|nr:MFS transporter [Jannaschia seohaensis]PWJ20583.1 putative MFS family arabinose efflux permease [Jannaschia seohaensis]SSA44679.1 Predicted arabinose efflux permease, MFS family [Jannaschia seohaensis]